MQAKRILQNLTHTTPAYVLPYPYPGPVWVPDHWEGPYWVPGHWA